MSLKEKGHHKLAQKFYGSYMILQCIGQVSYRLAHPTTTRSTQSFMSHFSIRLWGGIAELILALLNMMKKVPFGYNRRHY